MKLESLIPEIRQIRKSTQRIIIETIDADCPLQEQSRIDIKGEVKKINDCLLRIEAINV